MTKGIRTFDNSIDTRVAKVKRNVFICDWREGLLVVASPGRPTTHIALQYSSKYLA